MKHLPLLTTEELDPEIRTTLEKRGYDLAIFHAIAHWPEAFMKWSALSGTTWVEEDDGFPLLLKEMAVVCTSALSNSSYECGNHGVQMIRRGGTQEQLDAIVAGNIDSNLFDDMQKLVLQFTKEVTLDGKASEASLTEMSKHYNPRQIMQLIVGICMYMMNSRLASACGCELGDDEDFGMFSLGRKT
ncbi:MAG: hypothetical protein AAF512_08990 [Pseudomonadota bacterium]